ncbi:RNA polymerase II transcription factor SIII subunit A-domain-containing protein [Mycena crocata]|nr:RNA polymerase II transcription factor SIII subunit A-domain-containing protein [Mycena crocata]
MSFPDGVPSLVFCCQRVAAVNVDAISSLGDELRYDLVKPILERCAVDQLLRLEQASPHLQKDTPEIWKELCFRTYPSAAEQYHRGQIQEPESWKDQYFVLVEEEARRIEEVGSKIRRQRLEADERKKETEIKMTNLTPPSKRRWGVSVQPKTLFQKTKSEASRLQKNMYAKPMFPPMPTSGKNYRVLPPGNTDLLPASKYGVASTRVTVTTVVHRVSAPGSAAASGFRLSKAPANQSSQKCLSSVVSPTSSASASSSSSPSASSSSLSRSNSSSVSLSSTSPKSTLSSASLLSLTSLSSAAISTLHSSAESPPKKQRLQTSSDFPTVIPDSRPPKHTKRDPMASLFLPKHRAYSQRTT